MTAALAAGWLTVPYSGTDATLVEIAVTRSVDADTVWTPAFLDYADGVRVAKVRPPAAAADLMPPSVWLRVGGAGATNVGRYPA